MLLYMKGTGTAGWDQFDGTSASAPLWAALITRMNDARLRAHKPPLGFINPMLYQFYAAQPPGSSAAGFTDLPVGNNSCTRGGGEAVLGSSASVCCKYGFTAAARMWDPVTGLGSPRFEQLLAYAKGLP
jgi:tripeptidyl-peptidase-1